MSLDVYLFGERVGTLFPAGDNDYRLAYDPEVVQRVGPGRALLSNSLPARPEPYSAEATRAYVEGLLPEGSRRARLGRELEVDAADGYLLLERIGQDCPGAVSFLPPGEAPRPTSPDALAWLDEDELIEAVKRPGAAAGSRMSFSLPGLRHKLALVRDGDGGRWAWPEAGAPSTHVLKPETGEYPEYVANEMFCMTVCRQVGLPVAKASVEEVGGRRCLVSPRYDRVVGESGVEARRLHCESFCQALGVEPGAVVLDEEGRESEPPGWAEARGLLSAVSRPDEVVNLLTAAFCNYILGNGDAHGGNFVLIDRDNTSLSGPEAKWRLAPLTDLTSTVVYDDPIHRGLVISEEYQETSYLLELAEVCEECEFDFEVMRGLASTTATRVGMAVETIATRSKKEGWHEPIVDKIVEIAADRSFGLGAEVEY